MARRCLRPVSVLGPSLSSRQGVACSRWSRRRGGRPSRSPSSCPDLRNTTIAPGPASPDQRARTRGHGPASPDQPVRRDRRDRRDRRSYGGGWLLHYGRHGSLDTCGRRLRALPRATLGRELAAGDTRGREHSVQLWRGLEDVPSAWGSSVVTIGVFDGVHRGHQRLVARAIEARAAAGLPVVAVTFDPHPDEVVRPGTHPLLLVTPRRRVELLAELGVDAVCVLAFTCE